MVCQLCVVLCQSSSTVNKLSKRLTERSHKELILAFLQDWRRVTLLTWCVDRGAAVKADPTVSVKWDRCCTLRCLTKLKKDNLVESNQRHAEEYSCSAVVDRLQTWTWAECPCIRVTPHNVGQVLKRGYATAIVLYPGHYQHILDFWLITNRAACMMSHEDKSMATCTDNRQLFKFSLRCFSLIKLSYHKLMTATNSHVHYWFNCRLFSQ